MAYHIHIYICIYIYVYPFSDWQLVVSSGRTRRLSLRPHHSDSKVLPKQLPSKWQRHSTPIPMASNPLEKRGFSGINVWDDGDLYGMFHGIYPLVTLKKAMENRDV